MYRLCIKKFDYDDYTRNVLPQKYPVKIRKKIIWNYDDKVNFIEKETRVISRFYTGRRPQGDVRSIPYYSKSGDTHLIHTLVRSLIRYVSPDSPIHR